MSPLILIQILNHYLVPLLHASPNSSKWWTSLPRGPDSFLQLHLQLRRNDPCRLRLNLELLVFDSSSFRPAPVPHNQFRLCHYMSMSTHVNSLAPRYSRILIIPLQLLVQRRVASVRLSDSHFIFPFRPNLFSLKTRTPIVLQSDLNGGAACPAQENKTCYDASCNGQPAQAPSAGPCIGANCQPGKI